MRYLLYLKWGGEGGGRIREDPPKYVPDFLLDYSALRLANIIVAGFHKDCKDSGRILLHFL